MNSKNSFRKLLLIIFFPLGALLFYISSFTPNIIEKIFSEGFYKILSQCLSLITGIVPISVAEIGVILLILLAILYVIFTIIKLVRQKIGKWLILLNFVINICVSISLVYFSLVIIWSLNYHRFPFSQIASLDIRPSSVEELTEVCSSLIDRADLLRAKLPENSKGVMYLKDGHVGALKRAYKGFENASKTYPQLGGLYGSPKGVLLSKEMSYTGISGIFCPYTGEANVDIAQPDSMIPCTACHEMAHQRGFAREDEANYISYLVCNMHPDIDFQYSGTLLALIHSMNALYGYDRDAFNKLYNKYSPGIVRDLRQNNEFWDQYQGPVEKVADKVNDTYLKANMQKDGVQSYGRMVDLLIAEYRKKNAK